VNETLRLTMLMLLSLVLTGCAGVASQTAEPRLYWRGMLVQDAQGYWFELCGKAARHPVVMQDEIFEREYARQTLGDGWPVYIEAFGRVQNEGVALVEPVLIGGSLKACDFHMPGIELRGVSSRDRAVFDLRERHIRVHYRDSLYQLGFERPEVERLGRKRRWSQAMASAGGRKEEHQLLLEIEKRGCEGPQGGWYALTLAAEVDGRSYSGCARMGELEHWRLFTRYRTADTLTTRRLSLQLEAGGRARLLEDYLNQQPVIEYNGRWLQSDSGTLTVWLDTSVAGMEQALQFRPGLDGRLELTRFHPAYGRALELIPSGQSMLQREDLDWWR